MKIIPAIDLLDGQAVRLTKGDYNEKIVYNTNPLSQAEIFKKAGFDHIHVIDLNGAKSGQFENLSHIRQMIRELDISVQTGGGVRSFSDVQLLLESGVSKVICSSMAVRNPDDWLLSIQTFPGQCILGLDLKEGQMAYGGWLKTSDQKLEDFLNPMIRTGLVDVLSTDISRDGTLNGPNIDMYIDLKQRFPNLNWIASGGVSSMEDLNNLKKTGVSGVIVGKAYYEKRIGIDELMEVE